MNIKKKFFKYEEQQRIYYLDNTMGFAEGYINSITYTTTNGLVYNVKNDKHLSEFCGIIKRENEIFLTFDAMIDYYKKQFNNTILKEVKKVSKTKTKQ